MKYIFIIGCIFIGSSPVLAQFTITAENGLAINRYNDVRYFNETNNKGTLFSLTDDFEETKPSYYARIELKYQFLGRNILELTAAPLSFDYKGYTGEERLRFGANTYPLSGDQITGRYEFNTYRLSYRYQFIQADKWTLSAGLTVLARDARIAISSGTVDEETTDLGFVPLVSFDLKYLCTDRLNLILKGDALVGSAGRAEDVFLGANYQFNVEALKLRAGYRIIEGGADVSQVYNFSLIHFAALGLSYTF